MYYSSAQTGSVHVKTGTFCENGSSLACASDDGLIALIKLSTAHMSCNAPIISLCVIVCRIDNKGKSSFHSKQQLDIYSDGYAVEISHFGSGVHIVLKHAMFVTCWQNKTL